MAWFADLAVLALAFSVISAAWFGIAYALQRAICKRYLAGKQSHHLRQARRTDAFAMQAARRYGPATVAALWLAAIAMTWQSGQVGAGAGVFVVLALFILMPFTAAAWGFELALHRSGLTQGELDLWLQYGKDLDKPDMP